MGRKTGTVAYIKNKPGTVSRAEGKREKRQEEGKKNREKMAQERDIEKKRGQDRPGSMEFWLSGHRRELGGTAVFLLICACIL